MMRMSRPSFSDNCFRLAVGGRVFKWAIWVCKGWCYICNNSTIQNTIKEKLYFDDDGGGGGGRVPTNAHTQPIVVIPPATKPAVCKPGSLGCRSHSGAPASEPAIVPAPTAKKTADSARPLLFGHSLDDIAKLDTNATSKDNTHKNQAPRERPSGA